MRIRKPPRLALLTRVYEDRRRFRFAVTVFGAFRFDSPDDLLPEPEMWDFVKAELKDAPLDIGMPKLRPELLVHGRACAPSGRRVTGLTVRVRVGGIEKSLAVSGNRHWQLEGRLVGRLGVSEPEPFAEMPLTWDRAFGGPGFATNPVGKGWLAPGADVHGAPLPNIEHPDHGMRNPGDCPASAGFAPWEFTWAQRRSLSGTYDEDWLASHSPGLPPDADWSMFNAAPLDQRFAGPLAGGEAIELSNLHPDQTEIRTRLPNLRARTFVTRELRGDEPPSFAEIALALDTVWLFPHALTGIVAWRGTAEVAEDDATDLRHLLLAYERLDDRPRSHAHYAEALANRLRRGPELAELQKDFSDIAPTQRDPAAVAMDEALKERTQSLAARIRARVGQVPAPPGMPATPAFAAYDKALGGARALLAKVGRDPRQILPQDLVVMSSRGLPMINPAHKGRFAAMMPAGKLGDDAAIDAFVARWDAYAGDKVREAERQMGDTGRFAGANLQAGLSRVERAPGQAVLNGQTAIRDHIVTMAEETGAGGSALAEAASAVQGVKNDADAYVHEAEKLEHMENRLRVLEQRAADQARKEVLGGEVQELKMLRGDVLAQREAAKAAFERFTYMGAPAQEAQSLLTKARAARRHAHDMALSTLPWQQIQALRNAPDMVVRGQGALNDALARASYVDAKTILGADFAGLDMEQRRFVGLVLHQVDMRGIRLGGSNLARAVVTAGRLADGELSGVSLREAVLDGVAGPRARFTGADLRGARLVDADLAGCDFRSARLDGTTFLRCRLDGADFTGCALVQVAFQKCAMTGLKMTGATLTRVVLAECDLRGGDLSGLKGEKALFVRCRGERASLVGADAANLRLLSGSLFREADLAGARLPLAGMVGADLTGARLNGARLDQSALVGAALAGASLRGTSLRKAILRKADLTAADMTGARLNDANLGGARLDFAKAERACLFGADTLRTKIHRTGFTGANLLRTRLGMGLL